MAFQKSTKHIFKVLGNGKHSGTVNTEIPPK